MSDTPPEFDLKFLPDWLKSAPSENRYANYEGESDRPRRGDRDDRRGPRGDRRGPRPGGPGGPGRPGAPGGPRREGGGPRPQGRGPGGDRRQEGGPRRQDDRRRPGDRNRPPQEAPAPAKVRLEFLPEPSGAQSIAKQVKGSSRAYPLFSTGRLFLERPERHRVRITSLEANAPLFQVGDGPVTFDRASVERNAFRQMKDQYYKEETTQGEPLKGNYTNVARLRGPGTLLGPTNYHSYQPTLRKIYEERYSRRMSFQEFTQREIEVVTDEQAINDWKEQARSTTTFTTTQEAEPVTFKSAFEAEQHFRKTYLPQVIKTGLTLECSGPASRSLPERGITAALRDAWEKERGFPAQIVNHLRPYLLEAGLHFFKHRKRVLYISAIKPLRLAPGQDLSGNLAAIVSAVEANPKLTRRDLATKVLGENHEAPEMLEQKAALARDLHYLVHAGHVIEFHDGTLDLPLPPGGGSQQQQQGQQTKKQGQQTAAASTPTEESSPEAVEESSVISEQEILSESTSETLAAEDSAHEATPAVLTTAEAVGSATPPSTLSDEDLPASLTSAGEAVGAEPALISAATGSPTVASESELTAATPVPNEPVVGESLAAGQEVPAEAAVVEALASVAPASIEESEDSLRSRNP